MAVPLPGGHKMIGHVDRIDPGGIGGWVVDFAQPGQSARVRVVIDEMIIDVLNCDMQRDDAAKLKLPQARIGFYYHIPKRFHDGLRHSLRFATLAGARVMLTQPSGSVHPELSFCLKAPLRVEGRVDGLIDGVVQGWALNIDDTAKTRTGGVRLLVMAGSEPVGELLADQYRADVAQVMEAEAACGFSFVPPPELRHARRLALRFLALPGRQELPGSPFEFELPAPGERERINALIARTDELFTFAFKLRRALQDALPKERYLLSDYAHWAAKSLPLAPARARARYGALPAGQPLVTVICPVFRPAMGAFLAAVDSLRAQTYANWELLLVDDGSADAALTAAMHALEQEDGRIKPLVLRKNGGISAATNAGMRQAAGEFWLFFDHDDLLEPAALEIMLRAQAATGAELLYADEDKVEASGRFCEPHFKPDFNARLLLEVNYICHPLMLRAGTARRVGAFDPKLDGAQDHDFILRAVEILAPEQIHHVPEILYHWRKSADSTAAAGSAAKPQAAMAGTAAVAAHLKRRKLRAEVEARGALTWYRVRWKAAAAAKRQARVTILIPLRDQMEMTAACVAALRRRTRDVDYEIILLDNGSTAPETAQFLAEQANLPQTRVIRIAEKFNYSRINNMGAALARHEHLLFLNNDVLVEQPDWLRRMLDELLVDETVGAVGAKLLYPGGAVQHAGVVLGVGGVADHAFRGLGGAAPGYMGHALLAGQVAAVTGACMLVRSSAFKAMGGFDEVDLTVAFNDVDLCIKLSQAGWKIIFTPDVVAEHRESFSRGDDYDDRKIPRFMLENQVMLERHAGVLAHDPFYNPHFSREGGVYKELRLLTPDDVKRQD